MTRPIGWSIVLTLLTVVTAYAVFTGGADDPLTFSITVIGLGATGLIAGLSLFSIAPVSRGDRIINALALAFIGYTAFQLIPLPLGLLRVISPTRAEVATALMNLAGGPARAPLTLAPPTTWVQLSRITGYAIAFFVARQLVRRSPFGPWPVALPIATIAGAQAVLGFMLGPDPAHGALSGSYPNWNHFAGLLEMGLPLALGYAVSVLNRSGRRGVLALGDVARAALPLGLVCLMLAAVLFSTSKGGALACLVSVFFMAALAFGHETPVGHRWRYLALLTLLFLAFFIFLTPSSLVERFSAIATDQPTEGRVPIWRDTLRLFAAYPLFGCGLGAFFPGFLRYQFSGIGLAWTNAHNDYLQLLAELGLVGAVPPAALMLVVLLQSVKAASNRYGGEFRFLGLACAGSLVALLIHSLTDFNTYVTANGLVLAWIAGLAATLTPPSAVPAAVQHHRALGVGLAPVVVALSVATIAYGAAWVTYLDQYRGDASAERVVCHVGVCSTDDALSALRNQERRPDGTRPATMSPAVLREYLTRDSAAPYRWDELGVALAAAGRRDEARLTLARAVELGPTSASTLLNAAEFQFDEGHERDALALTTRALAVPDEQLKDAVFSLLGAKHLPAGTAARTLAMSRPVALAYLHRLLQEDTRDLDGARALWSWALERGYVDDGVSREYTTAMLALGRSREAWEDWVGYAKKKEAGDYPDKNLVFNGNFELDSDGGPFDWKIQPAAGVKVGFEREPTSSEKRLLTLTFDGTRNVGDTGVVQQLYLEPGRYVFRARIRSERLTTDEGVAFRISSAGATDVLTAPIHGTTPWTLQETVFDAPAEAGLVTVRVVRTPSLKFDKLVSGRVWIDAVRIIGRNPTP